MVKIFFVIFLVALFFYIGNDFYENQIKQKNFANIAQIVNQEYSIRLKIPSINVNASVQFVGVNDKGEMAIPSNTVDVGWFKYGTRPGDKGSAVIAGHFNGKNAEAGVFANLDKLKKGDKVYIEDGNKKSTVFIVSRSGTYDPGYADEVFSKNDGSHLNLITCDGVWDEDKKSYSKRLVVFTNVVN